MAGRGFWMNSEKSCADYFRSRPEYRRCFEALWKKWRSYGRTAGKIVLDDASEEECRAIGGITGKRYLDDRIVFSFSEFEQGLQKTRFAPVDIKKLLEIYFGKTLVSRGEQEKEEQIRQSSFFQSLYESFFKKGTEGAAASVWLQKLVEEKNYGHSILCREYKKDPEQARVLAEYVGTALGQIHAWQGMNEETPLAVFAAEISGNPHCFDRGSTAGMLLVAAICCLEQEETPQNAYQWRLLLQQAGIIPDNVSSMLHAYGLRLKTETGFHPAYDIFCDRKEPYVITMETLYRVRAAQPIGKQVYVVENEMVFTYLLHHVKRDSYTLLCTSGQLRAAAQKPIGLLIEHGAVIYYSGDLDPDGIGIADRLWQRYGNNICLWRMSPEDYRKAGSDEKIGEAGIAKLRQICHPELRRVAGYMEKLRVAGYQENILPELVEDIEIND